MMSIRIEFEIGHEAAVRTKSTPEGFTHDWEIFVRGIGSNNIQHYVEKVVFNLHETFPKPRRAIKEPPYKVKESGYAGFNFPVDIYLKNNGEPKKITFNYDLNLQQTGPPIHNEVKKHFVFSNVTDEFRHRLIKGGGTVVNVNSTTNEFSRETPSDNRSQLISKPKLGGDLLKKHKARLDEPKSNSFADLFGTPITKTAKVSPDQKSQVRTSPNVSTSKPEKSSSSEKSKSKHSPHKDKDREKSGKEREHDKKSKDEKRNKDKNKERDRSKEKSSKQRDKSPKRRSPSPKRSPKREPPSPLPPPPPPPPPQPKPKVEEKLKQHYEQGKEKNKTNDIKLEKKAKKDKKDKERDKERKEHKSHKDSSGSKSGETETKEIKDKGTKESIKHNKENKEKEYVKNNEKSKLLETPNKENHHDVKIEKEKEKSKLDKTENTEKRHKHKKKDKEKNKKDKEDKERSKEKEKKAEKSNNSQQKIVKDENVKSVQEEVSFIKSTNSQEAELTSVKEKPMLISEFSDDEHSDNSNGSLNHSDIEPVNKNNNTAVKTELKPPEPPEPIIEKVKKPEIEITKPEKVKKSKKHKDKNKSEKNAEKDVSEKKRKRKSSNKNKDELPEPDIDKAEEEPPTKILKETDEHQVEEVSVEQTIVSAEYMNMLKDLQHKIMTLQDNNELQRVVQMIAETGQYEITRQTFDFDLCALDRTTVRRLQDFFAMT